MPGVGAGVGHVHFMFFVLISFAFCSQRKPFFRWNMGFRLFYGLEKIKSKPACLLHGGCHIGIPVYFDKSTMSNWPVGFSKWNI